MEVCDSSTNYSSNKVDLMSLPNEVHLNLPAMIDKRTLPSLTATSHHFRGLKDVELLEILSHCSGEWLHGPGTGRAFHHVPP